MNYSKVITHFLNHPDPIIKRNAMSIYKRLEKLEKPTKGFYCPKCKEATWEKYSDRYACSNAHCGHWEKLEMGEPRVVQIVVEGGCVVSVVNLPDTCVYEIIDHDEPDEEDD